MPEDEMLTQEEIDNILKSMALGESPEKKYLKNSKKRREKKLENMILEGL